MRLPVNALLYFLSAGLLAQAGVWFYQASTRLGAPLPDTFTQGGFKEASELLKGRGQEATGTNWVYGNQDWWRRFMLANFTGKLPPQPEEVKQPDKPVERPPEDRPLEQIIELIALVYDPAEGGKAGDSQVIVRYRPEANVQPPEEELLKRAAAGSVRLPGPSDSTAATPGRPNPPGTRPGPRSPPTPPPAAPGVPDLVHYVRVGGTLWKPYSDIKLVRVGGDAERAFFARQRSGTEPKEEELLKSSMHMSQEVRDWLSKEKEAGRAKGAAPPAPVAGPKRWLEVKETTRQGDTWHIGTEDRDLFGQDADRFLERVHVESYASSYDTSIRGVQVRNIDPGLAQRYGVQANDVLLSLNNEPVRTKMEAYHKGKELYNRGVRTFVARFLTSGGQIVERTYQAPDR